MTTDRGANLLRTENGGDTAEAITASTSPLFAAGFANPDRAVAAGAGGATAVSNDGGRNYVAGRRRHRGLVPVRAAARADRPDRARARRARPARAHDRQRHHVAARSTSPPRPTCATRRSRSIDNGYALDQRGGLFRTANGGQSWQPIDPGTTSAPRAVITAGDVVLLAGPRGVRRASGGGEFSLAGRPARTAAVDQFDRAGSAIFAYGSTAIVRSTNSGRTLDHDQGPEEREDGALRLRDVDMTSSSSGFALDSSGRVWRTTNSGRRWSELAGVGTDDGLALAFGSPSSGYLTLEQYPADSDVAYVLRTTDSGRHWRPQRIASGEFPGTEGVISPSASRSYALTSTPAAGSGVFRSLFTTSTGGDAGSASSLTLTTSRKRLTRAQFRRANRRITVTGALRGAQGGEAIVVSARSAGSTRWTETVVTAGANGGRFTESFRVSGSAEFVARWAGDSGRQGAGSTVLKVTVR